MLDPEPCAAGDCLEWLNLISSLYSFLYSVALAVGMLASLPYWLFQMARHGKYRKGQAERLGRGPSGLRVPGGQAPAISPYAASRGGGLRGCGCRRARSRQSGFTPFPLARCWRLQGWWRNWVAVSQGIGFLFP